MASTKKNDIDTSKVAMQYMQKMYIQTCVCVVFLVGTLCAYHVPTTSISGHPVATVPPLSLLIPSLSGPRCASGVAILEPTLLPHLSPWSTARGQTHHQLQKVVERPIKITISSATTIKIQLKTVEISINSYKYHQNCHPDQQSNNHQDVFFSGGKVSQSSPTAP